MIVKNHIMFENVSPNFCRKYIINDQFRKTGQKITTFVQFCNKRKYIALLENCICKQATPKFFREIVVSFSRRKFSRKMISQKKKERKGK